ncbi:DEAD/DEAH box helicase [Mesorhizobium sp. LHD-90]|uniref:DEAD/DEAH box helicase n=1 Tax=Mesorhizobium sp. LHD-90 TaxID=3071414 RepID=UPI0027DF585C|nr:DEAD/DEAH box helicase [Mesorhizobium sp. LHD-90]MDQ6436652.1 DEAD/DEAH box helicase [Mesorhizobium sp. LHD-90]
MTPFDTLSAAKTRTAEAIIAQSGLAHNGLRTQLREMLTGADAKVGALLQEPLVEGSHPFTTADATMKQLAGPLLQTALVEAMDRLSIGHDYRFPSDRKPFRHQLEAWRRLLQPGNPQSVLVTSGTGSGKTECFLLPILSDLVRQAEEGSALEGVQAIMLYPLNALIESQRERLSAWTAPFRGKLRFCLYNGDLERSRPASEQRQKPEQVIDREQLRRSPPPILVTNITMLEYMLARAEDRPILDVSRGKLRWIVLDEAHSLVGAAAAEIALLLRRVLLAFGVSPADVRFVATSATIGSGEQVREQLQRFLADVAGIPEASVHVIAGDRRLPNRPVAKISDIDLETASPHQLYDALGSNPEVWKLVEGLFRGGLPLSAFSAAAAGYNRDATDLVSLMAQAARHLPGGELERLAPVRIHAFERAVAGFWSCINADCAGRAENWPFGRILAERADRCPSCQASVLEIISCTECGEPFLEGVESAGRLNPPVRTPPRDEFAFDSAGDGTASDDGDEPEDAGSNDSEIQLVDPGILFAAQPSAGARNCWLDSSKDWRVADGPGEGRATLLYEERDRSFEGSTYCPHCNPSGTGTTRRLKSLRFGAPFVLGNTAPILLDGVEPAFATETPLPAGGRRLLSFTDSRQGTARIAARLQREAERNFVRSFVYHQVQISMRPTGDADQIAKLDGEIAGLEAAFSATKQPVLAGIIADKKQQQTALASGSTDGVPWPDMVESLAERPEVSEWIKDVWQARDGDQFGDSRRVAEFLLLREFDRRPKRANSLETLGLARLRNPAIEVLSEAQLPSAFRRRGKSIADWKAYLEMLLTHFVRAGRAIDVSRDLLHWIVPKGSPRSLVGPDGEVGKDRGLLGWPNRFRGMADARPKAFLIHGLGLDRSNAGDGDDLDECLGEAWNRIGPMLQLSGNRLAYSFRKAFIAPLTHAYLCPVTRRVVDHAPFGISPYGLERAGAAQRAQPIDLPVLPIPIVGTADRAAARSATQSWLAGESVRSLRDIGAWSAFADRIALFVDYLRSAEHSAQQDSARLRRYEQDFRAGKINLLNCSTTMEMGVDIGSVSSVMMTNVPPSIANYRQRVGRAGRRNQATALAFTFCKDRPLDRDAFRDPAAFLERSVAAPSVSLQSRPIVQRHVNAYLLGAFMREQAGDALRMQIGAFLGCPAGLEQTRPLKAERPVEIFLDWLELPATRHGHRSALQTLVRRSILEGDGRLVDDARDAISNLSGVFLAEWEGQRALAKDEGLKDAGKSRMGIELKRLCEEFLLSSLADRGFLPGHGFPTDVVSFMPGKEFKLSDQAPADGRRQFRTTGPQRSLDLAIRDYAPGSEVVLDGLVHRSAGVTLNWKRPASEENLPEIQSLRHQWHCKECGASDTASGAMPGHCPVCGVDAPTLQEFLRPAGFSVDPREKTHAETDFLTYVAPEEPLVSTRDALWRNLPVPEAGRFRTSREGMVYYSNLGPQRLGYAVCLQCGRAGAETASGSNAIGPKELKDHKPLRFRRDVDICAGNDRPFSIKRHLALGHEITTDVFELQPHRRIRRPAADALAIALREALAQELGIEADEMGFATARSKNHLGADAVSLLLFDRAAGGAGFSTSLESLLRPVLDRADRILDCRTPGCIRACPACVLVSDAPEGVDKLDRSGALGFLRDHLSLPAEIAPEDRFASGAEICVSIVDEIDRELRRASRATLTLFLPANTDFATLSDWPIGEQLHRWRERGHLLRLAVAPGSLSGPTAVADRLALRDFAIRYGAQSAEMQTVLFSNGAAAVAIVTSDRESSVAWASRDIVAGLPGSLWGKPDRYPIARADTVVDLAVKPIDMQTLLPPPGAQMLNIGAEWDGDLASFGLRAAGAMAALLKKGGAWPSCGITDIVYQDPYVCAPLPARLAVDVIAALVKASGVRGAAVRIETRMPKPSDRGSPWQITHNWQAGVDQEAVVAVLGAKRGLVTTVRQLDVPHGRFMTINFADKSRAKIILDQGFGAWALPRGIQVRFDFTADHTHQVERLATVNVLLQKQGVGNTYVIAAGG